MLEIIDKFYKSRTNPPSPLATDRMLPSTNYIDRIKYHHESRSIEHHHPKSPRSVEDHPHNQIESRSISTGGVGRVRSHFLEFNDDYLHKPAPTDPIINAIDRTPTHIFTCTGS